MCKYCKIESVEDPKTCITLSMALMRWCRYCDNCVDCCVCHSLVSTGLFFPSPRSPALICTPVSLSPSVLYYGSSSSTTGGKKECPGKSPVCCVYWRCVCVETNQFLEGRTYSANPFFFPSLCCRLGGLCNVCIIISTTPL